MWRMSDGAGTRIRAVEPIWWRAPVEVKNAKAAARPSAAACSAATHGDVAEHPAAMRSTT